MSPQPNAAQNVVSTPALVIERWLAAMTDLIPQIKIVYDEGLSYLTSLETVRANNNLASTPSDFYPIFSFRRSALRYAENGIGKRSITERAFRENSLDPKQGDVYRILSAQFDLEFLYISKEMEDLERFEVVYLTEDGISGNRELIVDLTPEIGEKFSYFVTPKDLTDKRTESAGVYYKYLQGSVNIRGIFPVFRSTSPRIHHLNLRIRDSLSKIIFQQFTRQI